MPTSACSPVSLPKPGPPPPALHLHCRAQFAPTQPPPRFLQCLHAVSQAALGVVGDGFGCACIPPAIPTAVKSPRSPIRLPPSLNHPLRRTHRHPGRTHGHPGRTLSPSEDAQTPSEDTKAAADPRPLGFAAVSSATCCPRLRSQPPSLWPRCRDGASRAQGRGQEPQARDNGRLWAQIWEVFPGAAVTRSCTGARAQGTAPGEPRAGGDAESRGPMTA